MDANFQAKNAMRRKFFTHPHRSDDSSTPHMAYIKKQMTAHQDCHLSFTKKQFT
jgi:hypothetical protein